MSKFNVKRIVKSLKVTVLFLFIPILALSIYASVYWAFNTYNYWYLLGLLFCIPLLLAMDYVAKEMDK
jgi:hypothetical protein